ncbi:carotenoid oxygenase family protein [Sorangium sp. So ce260]|uniref:carotenoid oxygenase family protein n=1 Tax=Sorangium sp. So ce260 TaxID=3133291 RepID=UPI003F6118F6
MPIALTTPALDAALDAALADAGGPPPRAARAFDHLPDLEAEYGFTPLSVEGALPEGLEGTLFRVGPARATLFGVRVPHPFEADGGVLAVRMSGGRAEGAHRLVRSRGLVEELAAGRRLYGSTLSWPRRLLGALKRRGKGKNVANTSPFVAGGRLFALVEAARPTELDPATLDTLGESDLGGALGPTFSAHPHRVAARRTSYNFGVRYGRKPALDLYAIADDGRARALGAVPLAAPVMLHDFCATRRHLVFFVSPAIIRIGRALLRWGSFDSWVRFEPRRGTEVIVVDINDVSRVRRFGVDAFFQWHFANAYDDGEDLVVDLVRYRTLGTLGAIGKDPERPELASVEGGVLVRHRVRPGREQLLVEDLGGVVGEFPRCDPRVEGDRHGVVFLAAAQGRDEELHGNAIARVDIDSGAITRAHLARHELPSEPVFVPRAPGAPEGDGHVLAVVTDVQARKSALHVWDAARLSEGPLSRVHLPFASPQTFHGAFLRAGAEAQSG